MVKRQRRLVDLAIFLGPLMLTLAVPWPAVKPFNGQRKSWEKPGKTLR